MSRILFRYTFYELMKSFALSVTIFTVLFLIGFSAKILQEKGVLENIWLAVPYLLPFLAIFTLPMGLLTATLLTYARLSADNEIAAAQSSGLSLWSFFLPVLMTGVAVSILCFYLQGEIIPLSLKQAQHTLLESQARQIRAKIEEGDESEDFQFTQNDRRIFLSKRESPQKRRVMIDVIKDGRVKMFVFAENCFIKVDRIESKEKDGKDRDVLHLRLINAVIFEYSAKQLLPIVTPVESAVQTVDLKDEKSFRLVSDMRRMTTRQLKENMRDEMLSEESRKNAEVELKQRYSMAFTALIFVLIAFPLGIITRKSQKLIGFGMAIFIVIAVYYPLAMLGQAFAEKGVLDLTFSIWAPNILFIILGFGMNFYLFRR